MADIIFRDEEHKNGYERFCAMFGEDIDEYRLAVAYLLSLNEDCRRHYKDIFDFEEQVIKPEGLTENWQTSTSAKTTRLMFNLWNGYQSEDEPSCYTPEHLFACSYAPYFWQAIKLRYPYYCTEE